MATKNAASIVNAEAEWGTLEPGKLANILIVDGKPDHDIRNTRNIERVLREGTILDRDKLKLDLGSWLSGDRWHGCAGYGIIPGQVRTARLR